MGWDTLPCTLTQTLTRALRGPRYSVFTALFADDGNHPSEGGTYLESLVVASTISGARTHLAVCLFQQQTCLPKQNCVNIQCPTAVKCGRMSWTAALVHAGTRSVFYFRGCLVLTSA